MYLRSKTFRAIARDRLRSRYWLLVLLTLIAFFLGGNVMAGNGSGNFSALVQQESSVTVTPDMSVDEIAEAFLGSMEDGTPRMIAFTQMFSYLALIQLLMGGAVSVGLCRANLKLIGQERPTTADLFSGLSVFGKALGVRLLAALKIFLWTLLFIIPGIIATYRYAMANYVLAEDPEIRARDAIKVSKKMMHGNKWRLFCLGFSFMGWSLLAALPASICGGIAGAQAVMNGTNPSASPLYWLGIVLSIIAALLLQPYVNAATTAFYLDVSGQQERLHKQRSEQE